MKSAYDILEERGFIEQTTHEKELRELFEKEKVTFYVGFDPTADSLTVGHFVPIMAMAHLQRAGHRPIAVVGGGTVMVSDPTGKTEMRKMLQNEEIHRNVAAFKNQLSRFIDFDEGKAEMVNNADWLLNLQYIPFIREIGVHFSVNRMLTAEAYRARMERGLSFFEFNYMIMQSYDFLELYRRYGCKLQMGGNDQWSNILGGVELIRRVENADAFGMTFKLLTTSEGKKMGKTEKGAVWLNPEKTTPYEFFQYFRNVNDDDVHNCLCLLTFLDMDEVNRLTANKGQELNVAKERLAFEVTKIVHGEEQAQQALDAAKALFSGAALGGSVPTTAVDKSAIEAGIGIIEFLELAKLIPSRGEGRRIITQGGLKLNNEKIDSIEYTVTAKDFAEGSAMVQKGKKVFHKYTIAE